MAVFSTPNEKFERIGVVFMKLLIVTILYLSAGYLIDNFWISLAIFLMITANNIQMHRSN